MARQLNSLLTVEAHNFAMKKGFTLVELSIVLVIIGLLISGLLVGQSMITATKVSTLTREVSSYKIAISNFILKYGKFPGDSPLFTTAGDGDGQIDYVTATANGEWIYSWKHLSDAGDLQESYTGAITGSGHVVGGTNVPKSATWDDTVFVLWYASAYGFRPAGNYLSAGASVLNAVNVSGSIPPSAALAIDIKVDDGAADTGDVITHHTLVYIPGCLTNTVGSAPATAGDYDTSNADGLCSLMFKIDDLN